MCRKLQYYVWRVCNGQKLYILYRHVILRVALFYIQKFFRSLKKLLSRTLSILKTLCLFTKKMPYMRFIFEVLVTTKHCIVSVASQWLNGRCWLSALNKTNRRIVPQNNKTSSWFLVKWKLHQFKIGTNYSFSLSMISILPSNSW